jgi:hypothetical protein
MNIDYFFLLLKKKKKKKKKERKSFFSNLIYEKLYFLVKKRIKVYKLLLFA